MEQHADGKPEVDQDLCVGCRFCAKQCAQSAISYPENKAVLDHDKCVGCGRCIAACPFDAIYSPQDSAAEMLNRKMAEYAKAVVDGRPQFHISLVIDISPYCDCHGENDLAILPDVGMFASFDPVALDVACADAVNRMPVLPGSALADNLAAEHTEGDHFHVNHPETNWRSCVEHAEKLGLGTQAYTLVEVK